MCYLSYLKVATHRKIGIHSMGWNGGSIFLRGLQIGGISLFDSQPISWRWMFIDPNVIWNASVIWNAQATTISKLIG